MSDRVWPSYWLKEPAIGVNLALTASELDPKTMAIHEAGHAVVAHRLGERVIRMLVHESYAATVIRPPPAGARRARIERMATACLAGHVALARYQGAPSLTFVPSGELLDDVTAAAELVGRIHGITKPEVTEVLQDLGERAGKLLADRETWALVERLADELVTKRRLTAREVAAIVPVSKKRTTGRSRG